MAKTEWEIVPTGVRNRRTGASLTAAELFTAKIADRKLCPQGFGAKWQAYHRIIQQARRVHDWHSRENRNARLAEGYVEVITQSYLKTSIRGMAEGPMVIRPDDTGPVYVRSAYPQSQVKAFLEWQTFCEGGGGITLTYPVGSLR